MKELLHSHSIVATPAIWILPALMIIGLVACQITAVKALKFEDLREKS